MLGGPMTGEEMRRRKAWRVDVRGFDGPMFVFAETAGKARYKARIEVSDCLPDPPPFSSLRVRRAEGRDQLLPPRDPEAESIGEKLLAIVSHAYGGRGERAGYRGHFVTDPADADLLALVAKGLFAGPHRAAHWGDMACFVLTERGRRVAAGEVRTYPRPGE